MLRQDVLCRKWTAKAIQQRRSLQKDEKEAKIVEGACPIAFVNSRARAATRFSVSRRHRHGRHEPCLA